MKYITYQNNQLSIEQCNVASLANHYGTPSYIYSRAELTDKWYAFDKACGLINHQICFAVKANSNLAVLNILAKLGSGFDIVSSGELARVLKAGGQAARIIFSGVGKQNHEILQALAVDISCFNIESKQELDKLNQLAKSLGKIAPIALRVNPDISLSTHPYITTGLKENKFGVPIDDAVALYQYANNLSHIKIKGVACHLGSQIMEITPYQSAIKLLLQLIDDLKNNGIEIEQLDFGGGLGVRYQHKNPIDIQDFGEMLQKALSGRSLKLILEPGRAIAAGAGILLTKIIYLKHQTAKNFAIVDAGMNDLLRPALYQAWHDIIPVTPRNGNLQHYDIVGPVCETGDFLGKDRSLCIEPDDLLAVTMAGAYGFVMTSNYNTRARAAEIMVDGENHYLIRARENIEELFSNEKMLEN